MRLVPITLIVIDKFDLSVCRLSNHAQNHVIQNTSSRLSHLCSPAVTATQVALQVMPDDHSKLVPPLPIPNRTVKRLCADDSAATSVKVGHRQAFIRKTLSSSAGGFLFSINVSVVNASE